jgi:hypothetical protein
VFLVLVLFLFLFVLRGPTSSYCCCLHCRPCCRCSCRCRSCPLARLPACPLACHNITQLLQKGFVKNRMHAYFQDSSGQKYITICTLLSGWSVTKLLRHGCLQVALLTHGAFHIIIIKRARPSKHRGSSGTTSPIDSKPHVNCSRNNL